MQEVHCYIPVNIQEYKIGKPGGGVDPGGKSILPRTVSPILLGDSELIRQILNKIFGESSSTNAPPPLTKVSEGSLGGPCQSSGGCALDRGITGYHEACDWVR